MDTIVLCTAIISVLGALLPVYAKVSNPEFGASRHHSGVPYLLVFAAVVTIYGAFVIFYYRDRLANNLDNVIFTLGLFIAMIGGMFAQVITANKRKKRPLFSVSRDDILLPTLFSVIVFYPIWTISADSPQSFIAVHAAFLNGYFWENIVSEARRNR